MWRAYDKKHVTDRPDCATPLLAYFFRVDPEAAARRVADSRMAGRIHAWRSSSQDSNGA
jgi:hypothetical protein